MVQAAIQPQLKQIEGYICQLADLIQRLAEIQGSTLGNLSKIVDLLGAPKP